MCARVWDSYSRDRVVRCLPRACLAPFFLSPFLNRLILTALFRADLSLSVYMLFLLAHQPDLLQILLVPSPYEG